MSEVLERPKAVQKTRLGIVDCDIHPTPKSNDVLLPYLSKRWQEHLADFGLHLRQPFVGTLPYPRSSPSLARRDAWPPAGGPPGSDLEFMRTQHLDPMEVDYGIMQVLFPGVSAEPNLEFGAALCSAINDWQRDAWSIPEPRLKAAVVVPQEDARLAVAEIEKRAGDRRFVQVNLPPRANEPLGRRRYWPIYEAAAAANLPVGIHTGGWAGVPPTASGWPSYYAEEHHSNAHTMQALLASLILEGVPEQFPGIRFVFIEGGFGWLPATLWRLDKQWARYRKEVPHVKRPPSEYVKEHFWFTTQPIEEPENPEHLRDIFEWIGWDRMMLSTDYPHWDFDDPRYAFKIRLSEAERRALFRDNALTLYGLN